MSTRRSLAFSFVDRYASLAITVVSSMLVARLLTPTEIGIFSVAMVLIVFISTVRDMGAGQYLLQEKELTRDCIRAVWALQVGIGILLAAVVLGLSRPAAAFYDEPRVEAIMEVLAFTYLINPLGSVTYAWLMREMRYDAIAVIRFSSTLGGAIVSVWLAMHGHGAISLAWGTLASTVFTAAASMFFRPPDYPWLPGLREIRRVLSFGTKFTSASIVSSISTGAPEFVLGKLQNLTAAGLFSRAQGLVLMFNRLISDAVNPVALSLFSKEIREARDASGSFIKALSYISALSWTFSLVVICLAHPLIRLLYGAQWDNAVDLARVLAAAMAFTAPVALCRAAMIASGAMTETLRVTLAAVALSLPLTVGGAWLGLTELGVALLLSSILALCLWLSATHRFIAFDWRALRVELARSLAVALAASVVPATVLIVWGATPDERLQPLCVGAAGAAIGLVAGVHATGHPLTAEIHSLASAGKRLLRINPKAPPR